MKLRTFLIILLVGAVAAIASLQLNRYGAYLAHSVAIASIGALALNLLNGLCGQISFSQAALLGVGAYTAGNLGNAGYGSLSLIGAAIVAALFSVLMGLPSLRLRGLYFAISTLAMQFIFEYLFKMVEPLTHGISGLLVKPLRVGGLDFKSDQAMAALSIGLLTITYLVMVRVRHSDLGRAFLVVRENEVVARGMGINVARTKLWAFLLSGFFTGLAGGLMAFATRLVSPETFNLALSVDYVAMIIVGGLGSLPGSLLGAAFVVLLPEAIQRLGELLHLSDVLSAVREMAFGLLMILFLIFEPRGLSSLLRGVVRSKSKEMPSDIANRETKRNRQTGRGVGFNREVV